MKRRVVAPKLKLTIPDDWGMPNGFMTNWVTP